MEQLSSVLQFKTLSHVWRRLCQPSLSFSLICYTKAKGEWCSYPRNSFVLPNWSFICIYQFCLWEASCALSFILSFIQKCNGVQIVCQAPGRMLARHPENNSMQEWRGKLGSAWAGHKALPEDVAVALVLEGCKVVSNRCGWSGRQDRQEQPTCSGANGSRHCEDELWSGRPTRCTTEGQEEIQANVR